MSKYVFAFRNDPGRAATGGEEEAWTAWFGELGGAVTDFGNRVSRASMVAANGGGTDQDGCEQETTCDGAHAADDTPRNVTLSGAAGSVPVHAPGTRIADSGSTNT